MASYNRVILMGNLTRDPEVRYVPSGRPVADLGLAVNEKYKNSEGDLVERTDFFDITVWGPQGENCGKYLKKGRPVLVEGRLRLDTWENDQGEKRSKVKVIADRVQFLGTGRAAEGDGSAGEDAQGGGGESSESPAPQAPASDDSEDLPF
ncbi:MAG: single-stranded DNA-binding protein [Verrucomicrobiota bacterium]